ncbi:MAG: hypothetical protein ACTSXU_01070 [Promethearchaeota archaeon]
MRQSIKKKIGTFIILIIIVISIPSLSMIGFTLNAIIKFNGVNATLEKTPTSEFWQANYSQLHQKVMDLEFRVSKYHMEQGLLLNARFNDTNVLYLRGVNGTALFGFGDCPIWTGHLLAAEGFKFGTARREGKQVDAMNALNNISMILDGLNFLTHVTGIPGRLARYAWLDDEWGINRSRYGDPVNNPDKDYDDRMYEGSWNNRPYIWKGSISRDQHAGVIFGLSVIAELVNPYNTTIREKVRQVTEDLLDFMINSDWRGADFENRTTGADFRPGYDVAGSDGSWQLAFLQLGRFIDPEKYEALYIHHALDLNQVERIGNTHEMNANMNLRNAYYGNNIHFVELYGLIRLEKDPEVHERMVEIMKSNIWNDVKYHRNAHFNMLYLGASKKTNETGTVVGSDPELEYIIQDTLDGLMRLGSDPKQRDGNGRVAMKDITPSGVTYKYNYDFWGDSPPGMYNATTNQLMYQVDPVFFQYDRFLQGMGTSWLSNIIGIDPVADKIVPVNYRPTSDFIWQRSPYSIFGGQSLVSCYPGVDVILPYWMGRYFNFWGEN